MTPTDSNLPQILRLLDDERRNTPEHDLQTRHRLTQMEQIGQLIGLKASPPDDRLSLDLVGDRQKVHLCIEAVCIERVVLRVDLLGKNRHEPMVAERALLFWLTRELGIPAMTVERATGFNHATVYHGANSYQDRVDTDPIYRRIADSVLKRFIPKAPKEKAA